MDAVRGLVCDPTGGTAAQLLIVIPALLGLFSVIAKATPTKADNRVLAVVVNLVHTLGLTKKAAK